MDKSWISMPRNSKEFRNAVLDFIEFALQDKKKYLKKLSARVRSVVLAIH
jgi:hypothetical protein